MQLLALWQCVELKKGALVVSSLPCLSSSLQAVRVMRSGGDAAAEATGANTGLGAANDDGAAGDTGNVDITGVMEIAVPDAVFGGIGSAGGEKQMGALERFKNQGK